MTETETGRDGGDESGRGARSGTDARSVVRGRSVNGRAQTTLDFTVGVTVFLLVVATVFMFVPGLLQPFASGGQEDLVTANRVADNLAENALGDPSTPYVLNTTCTEAFFDDREVTGCQYDGATLEERVGVLDRQFVNVSLRGNVSAPDARQTDEVLCWDEPNQQFDEDCSGGESLAIGDPVDEAPQSSVSARRIVELDGRDVSLVVEVW